MTYRYFFGVSKTLSARYVVFPLLSVNLPFRRVPKPDIAPDAPLAFRLNVQQVDLGQFAAILSIG